MSQRNKYRNPPAPPGYVCTAKPQLVPKRDKELEFIADCIDFLIKWDVFGKPVPVADGEDFVFSSSSDDEEIVEIPVERPPKLVEVIDVDAEEAVEPDTEKVESKSHASTEISEDIEENKFPISPKVTVETELRDNISDEIMKKHDHDSKRSPHKKKTKKKKDTYDSEKESCSEKSNHEKNIPITGEENSEFPTSPKITLKTEPSENVTSEKIMEKEDCDTKQSTHKKKSKEKEDTEYDSSTESLSSRKSKHGKSKSKSHRRKSKSRSHSQTNIKREQYYTDSVPSTSGADFREDCISITSGGDYRREDFERDIYSCKIKLKRDPDYYSDDSGSFSKMTRRRSSSPYDAKYYSDDDYSDEKIFARKIKQEEPNLYGVYSCKVCNISMNSQATLNSHMLGKRHQKALNAKNPVDVVSKSCVPTEATSRYPKPPKGFRRVKLDDPAKIQYILDRELKTPCPGLEDVIEIHGVTETSYYCCICDSPCGPNSILPHLNGFKHQLNCLKKYKFELYDEIKYKQKYHIEDQVTRELQAIVKKNRGRGLVRVEKDVSENSSYNPEIAMATWRDDGNRPSTSREGSGSDHKENVMLHSIPDPSKSGFYCRLCDSHSNSAQMWQNHIVGKRHLANLKKAPGSAPSKRKYIAAPHLCPKLDHFLRDVDVPVVGLSQIREILKPEIDGISYNCFLCCCCISSAEIVDHIVSRKHREKYLIEIQHPEIETALQCQISESARDNIVEEIAATVELERGRGKAEVFFDKNAVRKI